MALPEGLEIIIDAHPEHGKTIQTQTDACIVNNANVEISRIGTEITFVELADSLEDQSSYGEDRLDLHVFYEANE